MANPARQVDGGWSGEVLGGQRWSVGSGSLKEEEVTMKPEPYDVKMDDRAEAEAQKEIDNATKVDSMSKSNRPNPHR